MYFLIWFFGPDILAGTMIIYPLVPKSVRAFASLIYNRLGSLLGYFFFVAQRVLASKRIMAAVVSSPNDSAHRLA